MEWYIIYRGQQIGPMTKENLMAYSPTHDTMVWREGMADWQPIYRVPELMELLEGIPGPTNSYSRHGAVPPHMPVHTYSGKDKTVAGILALLLGTLGIQYFYIGKIGGGFLTILLSLVTCGFWGILVLVQGILMLTMTQEEFDRKFVYSKSVLPLF